MASTFTPGNAFDYAKRFLKNMPLEQVQSQILSDVSSYIWMSAPWRWSVGTLAAVPLVTATQDYTVAIPNDFLFLQDSYVTDSNGLIPRHFNILPYLPAGGQVGTPSSVAIISPTPGGTGTFRLFPQPGNIPAGWQAINIYKKQAPVITPKTINTAGQLVFDDEWFWVYVSGVLYYAYLFGDDQRAGGAQIDPTSGKVTFSGQRGVWEANIALMKSHEKLPARGTVVSENKDAE